MLSHNPSPVHLPLNCRKRLSLMLPSAVNSRVLQKTKGRADTTAGPQGDWSSHCLVFHPTGLCKRSLTLFSNCLYICPTFFSLMKGAVSFHRLPGPYLSDLICVTTMCLKLIHLSVRLLTVCFTDSTNFSNHQGLNRCSFPLTQSEQFLLLAFAQRNRKYRSKSSTRFYHPWVKEPARSAPLW